MNVRNPVNGKEIDKRSSIISLKIPFQHLSFADFRCKRTLGVNAKSVFLHECFIVAYQEKEMVQPFLWKQKEMSFLIELRFSLQNFRGISDSVVVTIH